MLSETKTGGVLERGWAHPAGRSDSGFRAVVGENAGAREASAIYRALPCPRLGLSIDHAAARWAAIASSARAYRGSGSSAFSTREIVV